MAYLAEVQLPAASKNAAGGSSTPATEYGLTMRGHLANVDNGVCGLPRMHGANLSYHILGAASAEIPMTQSLPIWQQASCADSRKRWERNS